MNKKTLISLIIIAATLIAVLYFYFPSPSTPVVVVTPPPVTSVMYKNTEYGFNFTLPTSWQGYAIIKDTWKGTTPTNINAQSGPKLLIRNPKWTTAAPYEDLPIIVFTIAQWDAYVAEKFSVFAAPIKATELARNNVYVFALPPRWNFDYSLDYKEAEDIIAREPLQPFDIVVKTTADSKLNINFVCERVTNYITFTDAKSADAFISDCKQGKHPEVIEKYKADMNLVDGATI